MTLVPRVVIGQRGSEIGFWMSKPGENVLTAPDDKMLLSPTNPALAFLVKGRITLAKAAQVVNVPLGTTLSRIPLVWPQVIRNGILLIPPLQADSGLKAVGGAPSRFKITASTSSFAVTNLKNVSYVLQYMVLHYPVK